MGDSIKLSGKVIVVFETKQISDRFSKREFVVRTDPDGKYPQEIMLQITNDKVSQLDTVNVGDSVTCDVNIRGREWKSPAGEVKYFTTLEAWRVEVTGAAGVGRGGKVDPYGNVEDDIPF